MENLEWKPAFVNKPLMPFAGEYITTFEGGVAGDKDLIKTPCGELKIVRNTGITVPSECSYQQVAEKVRVVKDLKLYGFHIPKFEVVVAHDIYTGGEEGVVYMVVDYVDGITASAAPRNIIRDIFRIYNEYVIRVEKEKKLVMNDIYALEQYIYGSVNGEGPRPYLVDIDLSSVSNRFLV